jgi:hypothetical protein
LIDEMRRAQDSKGIDLAAIHKLPKDQTSFDGFPDADVIGYQQTWHLEAQRHQKGNELIGPWLESELRG